MNLSIETNRGRKTKYSVKKIQEICKHIARGIPLRYSAPLCGIPFGTAKEWMGVHPEMCEMMDEAHSKFVQNHVGNLERHSKVSEKSSQWLLERRAKQEFAPAYTDAGKSGSTLNVLALGDDALGKLMAGWSGMIGGGMKQAEVVDLPVIEQQNPNTEALPTLSVHNSLQLSEPPPTENPPQVSEAIAPQPEKQALPVEEVKVKRGRGRPRKYPKPDPAPTPPTLPTP